MPNIIWKKHDNYNGFSLNLTYEVGKKAFRGSIVYKDDKNLKEAEAIFTFQSLGIFKKIDASLTEDEMKKEALTYLAKKAQVRINELSDLISLIDEDLKNLD